jgi:poly-gamma-glutamate synthesis protein (capsule biosynthesis protein)
MKKRFRTRFALFGLILCLLVAQNGCAIVPQSSGIASPQASGDEAGNLSGAQGEMTLLFTGDIMYHGPTVKMQWDAAKKAYDFSGCLEAIAPLIQKADFAIGNLEAPVYEVKKSSLAELRFCAPPEAIDALKAAGFDVLCTANNHAMDQGLSGLANTIAAITDAGMKTTGTYSNAAERDAILMLEKNGIKVALLAYATGSNRSWRNNQGMGLNTIDLERMRADIKRAREQGADAVFFYLHFGTEYTHAANSFQKSVIRALKAAGADAVIGHHPHVLQPMVWEQEDDFFYAYSLGNVQTFKNTRDRQYAALLNLTVSRDPVDGKVRITKCSYVPTISKTVTMPDGKHKLKVFDLRTALPVIEAGNDPVLLKRYLGEFKRGLAVILRVLGERYMEPLADTDQ